VEQIQRLRADAPHFAPDNNIPVQMLCDMAIALLEELDATRADRDKAAANLKDILRTFEWFAKGVAAELGYVGPHDPGLLGEHIRGVFARHKRANAICEEALRLDNFGRATADRIAAALEGE
jgi:hypothetical protein